ncbi:MAG: response regulator transcription factor [Ignavibacteriales bacterium]|nr:MAG: response regulator transcription factor [Ignavibacteriales bacterium]
MIKILLADDHELFRKGLVSLIENENNIQIIGEARNGNDLVEKYFILQPDLIIADISMPVLSGPEAIRKIKERVNAVKVLFLSMFNGEDYIYHCYKSGGRGLVSKDISKPELLKAITSVAAGKYYFGPDFTEDELEKLIKTYDEEFQELNITESIKLTQKEEEILLLIGRGFTSIEIADKLHISKRTVDTHRSHIMQKLGLESMPQLIKYSIAYKMRIKST